MTKTENKKTYLNFGLCIPIPIQKCMKDFDFQKKVKITAP